jgi:hypothetical protein
MPFYPLSRRWRAIYGWNGFPWIEEQTEKSVKSTAAYSLRPTWQAAVTHIRASRADGEAYFTGLLFPVPLAPLEGRA